jgi:hypothetical protein
MRTNNNFSSYIENNNDNFDAEYDDFELLERLETLHEDMEELGIQTMTELVKRINELHKKLGDA